MANYWIGVVGSVLAAINFEDRLWWCFPKIAKKGDKIFMYCPTSISRKKQGIFALCSLRVDLDEYHDKNTNCIGFGKAFGKGASLFFGDLSFNRKFEKTLTAKDMKNDPLLSRAPFVRRNFQGTIFKLEESFFNRISDQLADRNTK